MANKKKTTVTTTEEETPYEEIHTKSMEELAADKLDEKEEAKEEITEPVVEEKLPVEEKKVEFDPEQLKREAAEEATNKILERLTGTPEKKDETDQELVSPWVKRGESAPKDWDEVVDWGNEKKSILDTRHAKEVEANTAKEREATTKAEQEKEQGFLNFIDQELNELYELSQLPKIQDAKNPKDPGVVATNDLLETMAKVNADRNTKGQPLIYSINKIYHHYYTPANKQPAGANAPVSGNRGSQRNEADEQAFVYARDHKKTFRQLAEN